MLRKSVAHLSTFALGSVACYFIIKRQELEDKPIEEIVPFGFPGPVNDVIKKSEYVTCYNRMLRTPNWVYQRLDASDHHIKRKGTFKQDTAIPKDYRQSPQDYIGSGFDKGHLAPAADMQSVKGMEESFLMTNVLPQSPELNRGFWQHFERFVRSLSKQFDQVHVFTGPLYLPKVIDGKFIVQYEMVGQIAVPTHIYKVIVAQSSGNSYLACFLVPNEDVKAQDLSSYQVPLSAISYATGLEFFKDLNKKLDLCKKVECKLVKQNSKA